MCTYVSGSSIQFFPGPQPASANQAAQNLRVLQAPLASSVAGLSSICLHTTVMEISQPGLALYVCGPPLSPTTP